MTFGSILDICRSGNSLCLIRELSLLKTMDPDIQFSCLNEIGKSHGKNLFCNKLREIIDIFFKERFCNLSILCLIITVIVIIKHSAIVVDLEADALDLPISVNV